MSTAGLVQAAKAAGFNGEGLIEAVAVALAESAGYQYAINYNSNGTADYGYWQINSIHGYDPQRLLNDPIYNAEAAYSISNGGSNWSAWSSVRNGQAQQRTQAAEEALGVGGAQTASLGGDAWNLWKRGMGDLLTPLGGGSIPKSIPNPLSPLDSLGRLGQNLTSGKFWTRIGEGFAALLLVGLALTLIFRREIASGARIGERMGMVAK